MKKYAGPASTIIVLVSLFYIGKTIYQNGLRIDPSTFNSNLMLILIGVMLVHFIGVVLMSFSWYRILKVLRNNITFAQCFYIMAKTQIAKYIPGNVAHYAGRHVLGARTGVSHVDLIASVLFETLWYILAAILVGAGSMIFFAYSNVINPAYLFAIVTICLLFSLAIFAFFSLGRTKDLSFLSKIGLSGFMRLSIVSILIYSFSLLLYSFLFWVLGEHFAKQEMPFLLLMGAFSLSWVIGFITPGAPGGIGVREAMIVAILINFMETPAILSLAIFFRLATMASECLLFGMTFFLPDAGINKDSMRGL